MRITSISAASTPSVLSHSDKVTGVLAGRHELDALTRVLEALGASAVEVLEGPTGAGYLDGREHSFRTFLDRVAAHPYRAPSTPTRTGNGVPP